MSTLKPLESQDIVKSKELPEIPVLPFNSLGLGFSTFIRGEFFLKFIEKNMPKMVKINKFPEQIIFNHNVVSE
jgi:hypothetical protein